MTLEVGNFSVKDVVVGGRTRWADGVLEIDKRELLDLVRDDPAVAWADIEVARPAESARIIRIRDIIEPKIKVEGAPDRAPTRAAGSARGRRRPGTMATRASCSRPPNKGAASSFLLPQTPA